MEAKLNNIGVDVGFGFVKAVKGKQKCKFPSVVGEARKIRYKTGLSKKNLLENLVVEIDSEKYFVGNLAVRQSNLILSTISEKRIKSVENIVLFLTAFALLDDIGSGMSKFNLVTGLPVDEYLEYKEKLIKQIGGSHLIKLINNGEEENKLVEIKKCKVIPQPFGTLFNQLLDNHGKIKNKKIASQQIGIIDIGFRTSDYTVSKNLEFVDKLSQSSTTALSTAYKIISRKLKDTYDINKAVHQLDEIVRNKSFTYNGKEIDIGDLVDKAFSLTAENIASEINTLWPNLWEMDKIFITGGGGLALNKYLQSLLDNCSVIAKSQFSNVEGYEKVANWSFGRVVK